MKSIADALGPIKMAVLPAFHALTGADVTGSFSGKGKATCWDEFDNASTPILQALANLGCGEQPDDGTRSGVEQLVCRMYQPKTDIKLSKRSDGPPLRKIKLSLRGCRPHKLLSIKPY